MGLHFPLLGAVDVMEENQNPDAMCQGGDERGRGGAGHRLAPGTS